MLEMLLRQSMARYETLEDQQFRMQFRGRSMDSIIVWFRMQAGWIQLLALFGRGPFNDKPDLMRWMMQQNHFQAGVKFSINPDGDCFIQAELAEEGVTPVVFQATLRGVVASADELYPEYLRLGGH